MRFRVHAFVQTDHEFPVNTWSYDRTADALSCLARLWTNDEAGIDRVVVDYDREPKQDPSE